MDVKLSTHSVSYASQFKLHWNKTRDSIFAACDVLVKAEAELKKAKPKDWEDFKDLLPVSDKIITKLLIIGRHPRLRDPDIYNQLPPCYSIIYLIAALKQNDLEAALKEGQISTRMHRDEFIAWRASRHQGKQAAPYDGLAGLGLGVLGLSCFARLLTSGTLSTAKTLKLKGDLDAIATRYGLIAEYSDCPSLQEARAEVINRLKQRFHRLIATYNSHVEEAERDLIENSIWQHRARAQGKCARYRADQSSSIEDKSHPFSLDKGWDYTRLLAEAKKRRIITSWTLIEDKEGLGEAQCLQFAIWYLEGKEAAKQERTLKKIAVANTKQSVFAEWCLSQIAPFGRGCSR